MTIQEVGEVLDVLEVAYPQFYAKQGDDKRYKASLLWAAQFADAEARLVVAAVQAYISNENPFPPSIGKIKGWIYRLSHPCKMTEMEAWALVSKAIRNGYYDSKKEFDKLPSVIQRTIGSASALKDWSMLSENIVESVIQSNFMRSYKAKAASTKEYDLLPESVKTLVGELGESISMPQLPEGEA